ncbi:hypothetical protein GCQ56_00895 [Marinifilum sp. N1E240]|uniref:type II toxin-antitoxin system HigB family toxin n=1 Tax=Marinifilum sp. N1E240 TaxID=2608082 RepID=UPI00128BC170|nr:type II toxin-antitoxin system HigB family toxin [Marinifilum sp. N1E240]MPQ45549.1 hypothetical protein [Marinifilum sp. N1E240]
MNIIDYQTVEDFFKKHNQGKSQVLAIYNTLKSRNFKSVKEITALFPRSSLVKGTKDLIVFRFKGNDYRMVIKFTFQFNIGIIEFVNTHAEYDKYMKKLK